MINLILTLIFLSGLVGVVLFVVDAAMGAWERLTELPEVGAFAADSAGKLLLAIGAAALAAVLALLVAQHGLWLLAAAGGGIVGLLKVIARTGRPPHSLKRRVAWRLGFWPRLSWTDRLYLGWSRGWTHRWRWAMARPEDSVGIIGPPGRGKTMAVIVPQLLLAGGPAISTSVKTDVLRATAARRLQLARAHGGDVYVYAPMARGPVEGLVPVKWSPLDGCRNDAVVPLRVDTLVDTADQGGEQMDAAHWRSGAKQILRGSFYAAAHHDTKPGDLSLVHRWVATQDLKEPLSILARLKTPAATMWMQELLGVTATPPRERASFFTRARDSLAATS
ncbi:MAG: type IV secretory system conjugative DNA transfer family protein, partial [Candidatus Dormibacteraeota bacterium]|nr:type IV secretory system conjugative DNA transfer family protein [Candidatus Dormibacteraeota bacterium]